MSEKLPINAHYAEPPAGPFLDQLRRQLEPVIRLTAGPDQSVPTTSDVLIAGRPSREDLSASPSLRLLIIPWAGLPPETRALLAEFPHIAAHNLHHNAVPVAEMVLALLLSAAKLLLPFDRRLRDHDWSPRYQPSHVPLLAGKTTLILGYGAIGRQVALYCRALGMRVLATRRHSATPADGPAHELHPDSELHRLLPRADVLLICLPHTPQTDGLIGCRELALLPENAVLVNVGRGPIIDEAALFDALQSGRLHAAGLDVWYNYPRDEAERLRTPPASYPFHKLDNVVMSPHRAGSTTESNALRMAHLAQLLNALAAGQEPPNRIDLSLGY